MCLSCFYIDGYAYQENELVRQHVLDGHDVVVIASTEMYGNDRRLTYVQPRVYLGGEGARVIRLRYRRGLPHAIMRKLRMHPGVYELLEREAPDVILFHGLCGWELLTVAHYKRAHERVRVFVDSHEDSVNSARSFLSRTLLHRSYYRPIIARALTVFNEVLCVSVDTMSFVRDTYGVRPEMLEFFPLGGTILEDHNYERNRNCTRAEFGIGSSDILIVQAGKLDKRKKLLESIHAFSQTAGSHLRLIVAGHIEPAMRSQALERIDADQRIQFVGWRSAEQLRDLLCAADVYLQPGTQSATMQMSVCLRCAVIVDDVPSHGPFVNGNGWLVSNAERLTDVFRSIERAPQMLPAMREKSLAIARELLDYRKLAARVYERVAH